MLVFNQFFLGGILFDDIDRILPLKVIHYLGIIIVHDSYHPGQNSQSQSYS